MERTYCKLFETHEDYQTFINSSTYEEPNISICKGFDSDHVHFNPIERMIICTFNIADISEPTQIIGTNDGAIVQTQQFTKLEVDGVTLPNVVQYYQFETTGIHTVKYLLANPEVIDEGAFTINNSNLVSVKIPYTVKYVAWWSIGTNNYSLTSIDLNSVEILQASAIFGNFSNIYIPKTVTHYGVFPNEGELVWSKPAIQGYINSITVDPENLFFDSRNNCNAVIETNTNALLQGSATTVIPNDIVEIKNTAFNGQNITSITIPESVTSIGENAFGGCSLLTSVYCQATVPPTLGNNAFGEPSSESSLKIYVPAESLNDYSQATNWSAYYSSNQILAMQS